ncbi:MAG: hypothetical protein AABX38_02900 [Candidatus Micrarchaeota archaeon]
MSLTFDLIKANLSDSKDFLIKNFVSIFIKYSKAYLLTLVVSIIIMIVLAIPLGIANFGSKSSFGLLMLPVLFIVILVSSAMQSVIYNLIDNTYKKKDTAILGQMKENSFPVIKYYLIALPVLFILLYPIIMYVISSSATANPTALPEPNLLVWLVLIILAAILAFFVQFGLYELLLSKKDVIESFKGSFEIAKNNLSKVFVFDLMLIFIFIVIQVIASISSVLSSAGPIGVVIYLILSFALGLTSHILLTTLVYFFYMKINRSSKA